MNNVEEVLVKKLNPKAKIPEYQSSGASGFDIVSLEPACIRPGRTVIFSTGLAFKVPKGFELQIRSRSGLASKGIIVMNQPGTLDSDYVGELRVLIHYASTVGQFNISIGDRIAQAILCPVYQADFVEVNELPITARGDRGLGSTGR